MPAISFLFVLYLFGQALLGIVVFRLARRRGDAAVALSVLVVTVGVIGPFVVGAVLEVLLAQLLCLGLYAFISRPDTGHRPSQR